MARFVPMSEAQLKLHPVLYWYEAQANGRQILSGISPEPFIGAADGLPAPMVHAVCRYLDAGQVLNPKQDLTGEPCRICGEIFGGYHDMTDGLFVWPDDASHYIRAHGCWTPVLGKMVNYLNKHNKLEFKDQEEEVDFGVVFDPPKQDEPNKPGASDEASRRLARIRPNQAAFPKNLRELADIVKHARLHPETPLCLGMDEQEIALVIRRSDKVGRRLIIVPANAISRGESS